MREISLNKIDHQFKPGQPCPPKEANITDDVLFIEDGEPVGFYLKRLPQKLFDCAEFCNNELLSDKVPKKKMDRGDGFEKGAHRVKQFSTIIGAVPKRPYARRHYNSVSSIHTTDSAKNFIKGMKLLAKLCENLITEIMPDQATKQKELIKTNIRKEHRFSEMFTSSISNFNITADFHVDVRNLKNTVNVIINKKSCASGGHLFVPDYDACLASIDGSITVYPAWKSLHGVTPIVNQGSNSYRNTLVFYPLHLKY